MMVTRTKRPAIPVECDDYVEAGEDGAEYHPHAGEKVWIAPGISVEDMDTLFEIQAVYTELDAAKGEPDEAQRKEAVTKKLYPKAVAMVARHVKDWDWTDDFDRLRTKPDGTEGPVRHLKSTEVIWLVGVLATLSEGQRKNGSRR